MSGTYAGGAKAAATNKRKYGDDYYARMGKIGGSVSKSGGYASEVVGKDGLTGKQRAKVAGAKGGSSSSRAGIRNGKGKSPSTQLRYARQDFQEGFGDSTWRSRILNKLRRFA